MKITDGRKRGWFWAQNEIFNTWGKYLKPNGIAVYLCLCRHANQDYKAWPGYGTIRDECGMSRRTAIRTIKQLIDFGLITCVPREKDDGSDNSNLYTILDISKVPLPHLVKHNSKKNKLKSNSNVKKSLGGSVTESLGGSVTESLGWCQTDTTPSVTESPPLVSQSHSPSVTESPEGNPLKETQLKETNLRNTTTTTTTELSTGEPSESSSQEDNKKPTTTSAVTVASKPDEDSGGLVFDFALKDFSPEQQRRALNLLKNIPTVESKQSVLDEFNSAYQQGTIKSPWRYLSTLVKKYQTGELTATSELPEQRAQIQKAKQRQQQIDACPYCNEQGTLYFSSPQKSFTTPCSHDAKRIVDYAIEHDAEIVFAPPSHRYPSRPQRNKSLTPEEIQQTKAKLAALIGGFQRE